MLLTRPAKHCQAWPCRYQKAPTEAGTKQPASSTGSPIFFSIAQGYCQVVLSRGTIGNISKAFEHGKSAMSSCHNDCFTRLVKSEPVTFSSRDVNQGSLSKGLLIPTNSKNDFTTQDEIGFIPRM